VTQPRRADGERGTTLAELVVAMLVFGVLAAFLATTVTQTTRLTSTSAVRENTAQRASLLVEHVTRDLRTAVEVGADAISQTAFLAAGPSSVTFYSSADPHVLRTRLSFATSAAAALAGTACTPSLTTSGCVLWRVSQRPDDGVSFPDLRYTDPTRTTVHRIVPPELRHTVRLGYVLKGTTTPVPTVTGSAALQSVVAVTVRVSVDGDGAGSLDPVVLDSTVRPYNR
jgi:type II secretory pathway pseudopilin PulG